MISQLKNECTGAGAKILPVFNSNVYKNVIFIVSFNNMFGDNRIINISKNDSTCKLSLSNLIDDNLPTFYYTKHDILDLEINMIVYINDYNSDIASDICFDSTTSNLIDLYVFNKNDYCLNTINKNTIFGLNSPIKNINPIFEFISNNEYNIQTTINWNERIDRYKLLDGMKVILFNSNYNYDQSIETLYKFKCHLIEIHNKILVQNIESYILSDLTLNMLMTKCMQIGCNITAKIRKILRELEEWISITSQHSVSQNDNKLTLRTMIVPKDSSQPCLWCDIYIDFHKNTNSSSLIDYCDKINLQDVYPTNYVDLGKLNNTLNLSKQCKNLSNHIIIVLSQNNYKI